jgi:hypothetical protein
MPQGTVAGGEGSQLRRQCRTNDRETHEGVLEWYAWGGFLSGVNKKPSPSFGGGLQVMIQVDIVKIKRTGCMHTGGFVFSITICAKRILGTILRPFALRCNRVAL